MTFNSNPSGCFLNAHIEIQIDIDTDTDRYRYLAIIGIQFYRHPLTNRYVYSAGWALPL